MTKSLFQWRRAGVAGLGLTLAIGTTFAGAVTASAAPTTDDNTISPVTGAISGTINNPLGTIRYNEDFDNEFFPAGETTKVTLTLSGAGARFTPDITPTFTAPAGYTINAGKRDENVKTKRSVSYTFTVQAPAASSRANITVSGLEVDVSNGTDPGTVITVTSDPGDENPALKVLDRARVGGQNRYETAAKAFRLNPNFRETNTVVLSSGEDFPDALSANYLAGELNTGTLLTRSTFLSPDTRQAIIDGRVKKVYITGGTGAVSQSVENELRNTRVGDSLLTPKIQVVRLGGDNRYETNKKVNEYEENSFPAKTRTALIATGQTFADSLALGPIAYREHFPLLLVPGQKLGASAQAQLDDFNPQNIVIAGDTGVVSKAVSDQLKAENFKRVDRYGGADRTDTAAAVANWADRILNTGRGAGNDFNSKTVNIATGQDYADALSAGPLAGAGNGNGDQNGSGQVILLSKNRTNLGHGTMNYLGNRTVNEITTIRLFGLTGATSDSLARDAANAVGFTSVAVTPTPMP